MAVAAEDDHVDLPRLGGFEDGFSRLPSQTKKVTGTPSRRPRCTSSCAAAWRRSRTSTRARKRPPGRRSAAVSMTLMMSSSARSRPATSNASFVAGPEVGDRSVASRSRGVRAGQTRTGPRWVHGDHWLAMLVASTMAPANSNAATTIRSMPRRATSSDWRRRCDATGDPMRPGPMLRRALMSRSGSRTQRPGSGPNCAGRRRCDLQSCPCAGVSAGWPAGNVPSGPF